MSSVKEYSLIELSILKSLVFFDLFDFPLTLLEIYQSLDQKISSLEELYFIIQKSDFLQGKIAEENGFYFLKNRKSNIYLRQAKYHLFLEKILKARKLIGWLKNVPFLRGVAICNSLSFANARAKSDIDLFIIAEPNTLWIVRFFVVSIINLFFQRPSWQNKADTFCPSFFATYQTDLSKARLDDDPYFEIWLIKLLPIFDEKNYFEIFFRQNKWIKHRFPNFSENILTPHFFSFGKRGRIKQLGEWFFRKVFGLKFWDKFFAFFQNQIMPQNLKQAALQADKGVILNEEMLKFHYPDKREDYRLAFYQRLKEISSLPVDKFLIKPIDKNVNSF